ncbi:MAG: cohesin domain-containing protein [Desulfurella sp.]
MTDKNSKRKKIILHFTLLFYLLIFAFCITKPIKTKAAEIYLKSSQLEYSPNDTFKVEIRLNVSAGEKVTAIEGKIKYNPSDLKVIDFLTGNSILTFVDQPQNNEKNGLITFSGIIPGGYTGQLLGDPGESNLLGTVVFQVLKTNNSLTNIQIESGSRIFINDGQELKTNLIFKSLALNIISQELVFNPLNELESLKETDKIPPEEFKPEIVRINGQYFLVFNTQDKQSGIDHYEVSILKENLLGQLIPLQKFTQSNNLYHLKESDLNNIIEVKAVDKAGNERIATLYPQIQIKWYKNYWFWGIIIMLLSIFTLIFKYFRKDRFLH